MVSIRVGQTGLVQFSLPIDMVALEPDKTFQTILTRQNTQPLGPNQFFLDTITVTIQDTDGELKLNCALKLMYPSVIPLDTSQRSKTPYLP